ncbi:MAG: peptidyl-prolyl cis-trans isomerase [Bacteroidota bacterium]
MSSFKRNNTLFVLLILWLVSSCDLIQIKEDSEIEKPTSTEVARVGNQYLYADDLDGIVTSGVSPEDSAERATRFIDDWIKKQLLINEASTKIEFDEAKIERKILDYKYSLMGYEYQTYYINKNLNREVTDEEVQTYYEQNIDNFILKQNIIRGKFIKLPVGAPKINKVRSLISSSREDKIEELNSYCLSFATTYQLYDSIWMVFDEVIQNTPMAEIPNKVQYLKRQRYVETEDDAFKYFLKINEYKISDNISPLEFVKEDIKNIIINKRKVRLAQKLEEDVYEKAKTNNDFEIYD